MPKQYAGAATTAFPPGLPVPPDAPGEVVEPDPAAVKSLEASRKEALQAVEEAALAAAAPAKGGDRKTVTGVESALVTVKKPDGSLLYSAVVNRGQDVPAETSTAELDRLEALGVFDPPAPIGSTQTEAERVAVRRAARG